MNILTSDWVATAKIKDSHSLLGGWDGDALFSECARYLFVSIASIFFTGLAQNLMVSIPSEIAEPTNFFF